MHHACKQNEGESKVMARCVFGWRQVAAAVAAHSALAHFGELLATTPPLRQPCAGLAQRRNTLGVNLALEGRQLRVERCCLLLNALQVPRPRA